MQVTQRLKDVPATEMTELTRLKGAALIPYHLGRLFTYILLGGVIGFLGKILSSNWQNMASILMLLAGLGMIFSAFSVSIFSRIKFLRDISVTYCFQKVFSDKIGPLFHNPTGYKGWLLGIVLGFLPCGMVYAALALAASTKGFLYGAGIMAVFGLATIPALLFVGLLGSLATNSFKQGLSFLARGATLLSGGWLVLIALHILIKNRGLW